ncbi:hypothetical protein [Mariniblastus fucicola]|nr:hypothetical protein [Mariniblastus fucicola]
MSVEDKTLAETHLERLAQVLLTAINVSPIGCDPALDFEQLGSEHLKSGWMSGAVHPLSNRQLLSVLMAYLPKETLAEVGLCMMHAGLEKDIDGEPRKLREIRNLINLDCAGLDSYPDHPFVSINPAASSRDIKDSMNQLLAEWKREQGLSEQRIPSKEKLETYLQVWDDREGWFKGEYIRAREMTFSEIANRNDRSIKTVHNQYKSGFQLITGHEYSVDNWSELFGPLKVSEIFGDFGRATRLRPLIQKTRRAIPESVISSGQLPGFISRNSCTEEIPAEGLFRQIKQLIAAEKSDQEIAEELDLQHPEYLPLLRRRFDEI